MASIVKRNGNFCVVYSYKEADGTAKQKWETFSALPDAKARQKEIEYKESIGTFVAPQCKTLNDLLSEYIALYGRSKWAFSTYQSNVARIDNYIRPIIGSMKLQDITTRVIEGYYQKLLKYEAVDPKFGTRKNEYVSTSTIRDIHKTLRSAFEQAIKWELMEKNPCTHATVPKHTPQKREIWTAETLFHALEVCDDPKLRLCINLSFSCSLRLGELLGLTWDCVDISPESIAAGRASIYIDKELQRVNVSALDTLDDIEVIRRFPSRTSLCSTVQLPTVHTTVNAALNRLIKKNNLPKVVFHSFRHSSITYKLKLNGGDIKAVQGDSGHAQASMVTEQYAHILDDDRRINAQRFDDFFYQHKGAEPEIQHDNEPSAECGAGAVDAEAAAALTKLLSDPSMAALIKNLAKSL